MFETAIAMTVALSLLTVAVMEFADTLVERRRRAQAPIRPDGKSSAKVMAPEAANQAETPALPKAA